MKRHPCDLIGAVRGGHQANRAAATPRHTERPGREFESSTDHHWPEDAPST